MGAYLVTYAGVVKDDDGTVIELHVTYDPETRGGNAPDGRKVKGTIHWVSASEGVPAEVRLYERLFAVPDPENVADDEDFTVNLNPHSLETVQAYIEPSLRDAQPGETFQFVRLGYFTVDRVDSSPEHLVFNRTVTLKDTWSKQQTG